MFGSAVAAAGRPIAVSPVSEDAAFPDVETAGDGAFVLAWQCSASPIDVVEGLADRSLGSRVLVRHFGADHDSYLRSVSDPSPRVWR